MNTNHPDEPEAAKTKLDPLDTPFGYLLKDDSSHPNEFLLDVFMRDPRTLRDIFTSLVFADDGSLVFRVVDDVTRGGDCFGGIPFYDITLFIIDAGDRDALFRAYLETVPADEAGRRAALLPALKAALKPSSAEHELKTRGIPHTRLYRAIHLPERAED
jgi:hypothetical protein